MTRKQLCGIGLAALLLAGTGTLRLAWAAGGAGESRKKSLTGLTGVLVSIEDLNADAEQDGLTRTQIQTDVELALRRAGVRVLGGDAWMRAPGLPVLYVRVATAKARDRSLYAYAIDVALQQAVRLDRDPAVLVSQATTWSAGGVGLVGATNVAQIRDAIRDYVDRFANDYLDGNPRDPASRPAAP